MKRNLLVLFGGQSTEHEVSIKSAGFIASSVDRKKYRPLFVGISKKGVWFLTNEKSLSKKVFQPGISDKQIFLPPGLKGETFFASGRRGPKIDIVFPVLHGPLGEDGTVQGLLKLAGVPFVGASVLGSAVGMDKDIMKHLLREADLPVGNFLTIKVGESISFKEVVKNIKKPFFLKPANAGSSVGVHKVRTEKEFKKFLLDAFQYDTKVILEEFIQGREIECSVLGNNNPKASLPGEVVVNHDFYSYEAKYLDENGASLAVPVKLPSALTREIQKLAVRVFETLSCGGLGRVDFFLKKNNQVIVNEINTIPGFTSISMYPKLWAASGLAPKKLVEKLINLSIERFKQEQKIQTSI